MYPPRILYLSTVALFTLTAYALPVDQEFAIKARENAGTGDVDHDILGSLGQAGGVAWSIEPEIECEGVGCSLNPAIKAREDADTVDSDNDMVGPDWTMLGPIVCEGEGCPSSLAIKAREAADIKDIKKDQFGDPNPASGWTMDINTVCEGVGCPSDSAIKARDENGNRGTEDVDKDQIGGVFWSIDPVIVCEGEGCPL